MSSPQRLGGSSEPVASQPRATFCILAFNQAPFIEAAVRAAFAQSYDDLEIIISDDGSSDGTWERAQSLAAAYAGPHRVLVRRSAVNRGVLHHLLDIAELAAGRLLIVSAADDISLPQRTETMVRAWQRHGYAAAFTDYAIIDASGRVVDGHYHFDDSRFSPRDYVPGLEVPNIHGASSVYDLEQLKSLGRPADDDVVLFEDTWLSLALTFAGLSIRHLPEVLVQYRRHLGSITNAGETGAGQQALDRKWQKGAAAFGATLSSFRAWYERRDAKGHAYPLPNLINSDIAYFTRVGRWNELGVLSRLATLRFASRRWMARSLALRLLPTAIRPHLKNILAKARSIRDWSR